jgi:methionyl-tRNA formyltransferase
MKVVITCGRKFGLQVIQMCEAKGFEIVLVITPTDDKIIRPYCELMGHRVWNTDHPDHLADIEFENYDLGVTAHFFGKIPQHVISYARLGWLGYHPSLLPRHRGRSSIDWAIKQKDIITGGTLYWLNGEMDKGDIAYQDWVFLDFDKTSKEIWNEELAPMGIRLFRMAFDDLINGIVRKKPQAALEKFATYEPPV